MRPSLYPVLLPWQLGIFAAVDREDAWRACGTSVRWPGRLSIQSTPADPNPFLVIIDEFAAWDDPPRFDGRAAARELLEFREALDLVPAANERPSARDNLVRLAEVQFSNLSVESPLGVAGSLQSLLGVDPGNPRPAAPDFSGFFSL